MAKYRRFIRKYYIPLTIIVFIIIDSPQWIDAILSMEERMHETGANISWLWWITVPIGVLMLIFIFWQVTRPSEAESKEKWEHYNKLVDLIIRTETEPHENWNEIVADMQRELNAIGDNTINKHMKLYFPVLDEDEYVGIKPSRATNQIIIDRTRNHMVSKYKRWE